MTETVRIPARLYAALYGLYVEARDGAGSGRRPTGVQRAELTAAVGRVRRELDKDAARLGGRVEQVRCVPR